MMKAIAIALLVSTLVSGSAEAQQTLRRDRNVQPVSPAAVGSPMVLIYRVSGLRDTGSSGHIGIASALICTNFSKVAENVQFVLYNYSGAVTANSIYALPPSATFTLTTHATISLVEDAVLSAGSLAQGSAKIVSSSTNVQCTAMILDATSDMPQGIDLHMVRFNPHPGSME